MKLRNPEHEINVVEQNKPHDTFGWGIVFSDQTLENLQANDPESAETIRQSFAYWDDIDVHIHGKVFSSGGHGFIGIGRLRLLSILQERATELGIKQVLKPRLKLLSLLKITIWLWCPTVSTAKSGHSTRSIFSRILNCAEISLSGSEHIDFFRHSLSFSSRQNMVGFGAMPIVLQGI